MRHIGQLSAPQALQQLRDQGFKDHFYPNRETFVCSSTRKAFKPNDLTVIDFHRTNTKEDDFLIYGVIAPDGSKGIITNTVKKTAISRLTRQLRIATRSIF